MQGPDKEVYFPQDYKPGHQCQSDFSHMKSLGITINRKQLDHMIYHFILPYSNWENATICFSESFEALCEGLQNALWELGKVPTEHRTDRLSAAINNPNKAEFTDRYNHLLAQYKLKASRTNPYSGNENCDIEQAHNQFKKHIDQQLMLRGSRDFLSEEDYKKFLKECLNHKNSNRTDRFSEELKNMSALPIHRTEDFKRVIVHVTKFSTLRVAHSVYSVPSRLIKEKVEVHLYANHLEVYYGSKKIQGMPRLRVESSFNIQYRQVIDSFLEGTLYDKCNKRETCLFEPS